MGNQDALIDGFTVFFVSAGLLVVALCVPLILRRVRPNCWYGFRTPKTLADERVWYAANAYSGRVLLGVGLSWIVAAVGLRYVPTIGTDVTRYGTASAVVVLVGLVVVVALSTWRLRSL